jgi:hypothetical protein
MLDRSLGLPITFVLALSVTSPVAKKLSYPAYEILQRGSLKELLSGNQNSQELMSEAGDAVSGRRLAQSCMYGYWRRC